MNIYDFDKTIYNGDSTVNFYKYCVRNFPKVLISLPRAAVFGVCFKLGLCTKTRFKEQFYRFLRHMDDTDTAVLRFWEKNERGIKSWYLEQKRADDIIISASPEFLLRPICAKLGVEMMASVVDGRTGVYSGVNCDGKEKVRRLFEAHPDAHIDRFYSDSHSDDPLAELADEAFLVRGDERTAWK